MRLRQTLTFVTFFLLVNLSAECQRLATAGSLNQLKIRLVHDNEAPFARPLLVQLISDGGTPIQEAMSNDRGEVEFRSIPAGGYKVRVTGQSVKETEAELMSVDSTSTQYVRVTPASPPAAMGLGFISAQRLSVPDKARKEFEKGSRALKENDFTSAKKHLQKAVELSPGYAAALNDLGIVAAKTGEAEQSLAYFERAVSADSSHVQALLNVGRTYMMKGDFASAIQPLNKAAQLTPNDAQPFHLLATAHIQLGDHGNALANARKVHLLPHERLGICHFIAAKALLKSGGAKEEAITEYETFLKESPNSPTVKHVQEELARLR